MQSGQYQGMVIFVDRVQGAGGIVDVVLNGAGSILNISGTIYAPTSMVKLNGSTTDAISAQLICYDFEVNGSGRRSRSTIDQTICSTSRAWPRRIAQCVSRAERQRRRTATRARLDRGPVIVVVGSPLRGGRAGVRAAGLPAAIARDRRGGCQRPGLVASSARADGDVALSLATDGIGHVALQRIAAGRRRRRGWRDDGSLDEAAGLGTADDAADGQAREVPGATAPTLGRPISIGAAIPADYRVVVLAQPLDEPALLGTLPAGRART
jgi:hypothetical protein